MFQSMKILNGDQGPHSHLDDFESFFYILLFIMFKWKGLGGSRNDSRPDSFDYWCSPNPRHSYLAKSFTLYSFKHDVLGIIPTEWPQPIKTLLTDLRNFIQKYKSEEPPAPRPEASTLAEMYPDAAKHYEEFIDHIQRALHTLTILPTPCDAPATPTSTRTRRIAVGSKGKKRRTVPGDDDPQVQIPPAKRTRLPAQPQPLCSTVE